MPLTPLSVDCDPIEQFAPDDEAAVLDHDDDVAGDERALADLEAVAVADAAGVEGAVVVDGDAVAKDDARRAAQDQPAAEVDPLPRPGEEPREQAVPEHVAHPAAQVCGQEHGGLVAQERPEARPAHEERPVLGEARALGREILDQPLLLRARRRSCPRGRGLRRAMSGPDWDGSGSRADPSLRSDGGPEAPRGRGRPSHAMPAGPEPQCAPAHPARTRGGRCASRLTRRS